MAASAGRRRASQGAGRGGLTRRTLGASGERAPRQAPASVQNRPNGGLGPQSKEKGGTGLARGLGPWRDELPSRIGKLILAQKLAAGPAACSAHPKEDPDARGPLSTSLRMSPAFP